MRQMKVIGTLVVVLLAADLVIRSTSGHPEVGPVVHPKVVGIAAHSKANNLGSTIYRVWDDGLVEQNVTGCGGWCGWTTVPDE